MDGAACRSERVSAMPAAPVHDRPSGYTTAAETESAPETSRALTTARSSAASARPSVDEPAGAATASTVITATVSACDRVMTSLDEADAEREVGGIESLARLCFENPQRLTLRIRVTALGVIELVARLFLELEAPVPVLRDRCRRLEC